MSDLKISQMDSASFLNGSEVLPIVQSTGNKKVTVDNLLGYTNQFTQLTGTFWDGSNKYTTLTGSLALTLSTARNSGILYVEQSGSGGYGLTINSSSMTINQATGSNSLIGYVRINNRYFYSIELHTDGTVATGSGGASTITYDSDALAFFSASGITDTTQKNAVNQLVVDMKAASIWTKMKAVYPFVGGTSTTHKFNLKNPVDSDAAYRLVFNGTFTHDSTGITPAGVTSSYANTNFNPSSSLSAASASLGIYVRSGWVNNQTAIGVDTTTSFQMAYAGASLAYWNIGVTGTSTQPATANPSAWTGFLCDSRIGTGATSGSLYRNGVSFATENNSYIALPNDVVYIGARKLGATIDTPSTANIAFAYMSDGLTSTEVASLSTAVINYQTTLGRNV